MMDNSLVLTSSGVENQQYQNILLTSVQKLWNNNQMLDITFQADGQEVQAHQLVLAAASSDLCDALTQIQKTTKHAVLDLNRSGITMEGLKELLNYLYCGKMKLNPQLCQDVAKAAKTLHIPQVVALCALFRATFMPGTALAETQPNLTGQTPILNCVWRVEQSKAAAVAPATSTNSSNKPSPKLDSSSVTPVIDQSMVTSLAESKFPPPVDKFELYRELTSHKQKWMADVSDKGESGSKPVSKMDTVEQINRPVRPVALVANLKHVPAPKAARPLPFPNKVELPDEPAENLATVTAAAKPVKDSSSVKPTEEFKIVKVKEEPPDGFPDACTPSTVSQSSGDFEESPTHSPTARFVGKKVANTGPEAKPQENSNLMTVEPSPPLPADIQIKQEPIEADEEPVIPVSFVKVTKSTEKVDIAIDPIIPKTEDASLSDDIVDVSDADSVGTPGPQDDVSSQKVVTANPLPCLVKQAAAFGAAAPKAVTPPVYYKYKRKKQRRGRTHYVKPETIEPVEIECAKKQKRNPEENSNQSVRIVHVPLPTGATLVKPFAVTSNGKTTTAVEKSIDMKKAEAETIPNYPSFPSASGDAQLKTYVHMVKPQATSDKEEKQSKNPAKLINKGVIKTTVPAAAAAAITGGPSTSDPDNQASAESLASCFVRARGIKNYKSSYSTPHSLRNYDAPNSKYRDVSLGKDAMDRISNEDGKKLILLSSVVRNGCKGRFHISCILCHFLFSSVESCEKHILRKHFPGELIFADTKEGKEKLELERNTPEDKKVMFLCSCCGYVTHNERFIYLHRFYQHEVPILQEMIEPYCEACELLLNNGTDMEAHEKLHCNHYICNTCYKRYICLDSLCHHVREAHNIQGNTELFIRQVTYD